jgi:hypothetical protein
MTKIIDPLKFGKMLWPNLKFYREQKDIIYSVRDNDETFVVAGNMLGKDFVSAFIILWFFISRTPCRIVTTSADYSQLEAVLWGEIRNFIQTSRYNLYHTKGGPLIVNDMHIRKAIHPEGSKGPKDFQMCGLSYIMAKVSKKGEGMLGHHVTEDSVEGGITEDGIPRTLYVADEASGVDDVSYKRADTWADRKLVIGNPYPCNNFFFNGVKGGDIKHKPKKHRRPNYVEI